MIIILEFIIENLIIITLSLLITYGSFYIIYLISLSQGYNMVIMMRNISDLGKVIHYIIWVLLPIILPYIVYKFIIVGLERRLK